VGMGPDDLRLAVQPHATSKIARDDDLFNIHTMGFRGEALASIASVSRVEITSRSREGDVGHLIKVDAGRAAEPQPVAAPPGTTVAVRDLFHAVPARRKFLRTPQTEMGHVPEQFARLALAHPSVAFSLRHNNRRLHTLAATGDALERIGDFYGRELADVLLEVRREGQGVTVEGWAGPPRETRGTNKWEYVYVNGRYVRDRFVSHAIKSAYRSLIDPNRYPIAFLFITIDPSQIDVNVHPTKIEIRWRDGNYVHSQVLAALRDRFLSTNLDHTLRTPGDDEEYRQRVRQAMVDFFTGATEPRTHEATGGSVGVPPADQAARVARGKAPSTAPDVAAGLRPGHSPGSEVAAGASPAVGGESGSGVSTQLPGDRAGQTSSTRGTRNSELGTQSSELETRVLEPGPSRALQIHNAYLVAQTDDGLMIIDQHALHERILYEELRARIADRPLESQRLLLPEVVSVPADRIESVETHADQLARVGIELTAAGPQSVSLHAFPSLLERANRETFVRDLLDLLCERGSRPDSESLIHEVLDMMACKAAVKFGDPLTADEIEALLARKQIAERSSHCPHGRPTTLRLSLRDLERQFKRR
jgi:DNA mismatch repair protein MutL